MSAGGLGCLQTSLVFRMLNCSLVREKMTEISRFTVCSPHVNTSVTAMNQSCLTKQLDVMFYCELHLLKCQAVCVSLLCHLTVLNFSGS